MSLICSQPDLFRYEPEQLPAHVEVLERLTYVSLHRGFGLMTGPAGSGKTRLLGEFAASLSQHGFRVHRLDVTGWSPEEIPTRLAVALGLSVGSQTSLTTAWLKLEQYLSTVRQVGHRQVLLIDHVDRSQPGCDVPLDRLLTICQGGLACLMAARPAGDAALQRVFRRHCGLRIELPLLTPTETRTYLENGHRAAAGPVFSTQAINSVQAISQGRLRSIDRLAHLALEALEDEESSTVDADMILATAAELRL